MFCACGGNDYLGVGALTSNYRSLSLFQYDRDGCRVHGVTKHQATLTRNVYSRAIKKIRKAVDLGIVSVKLSVCHSQNEVDRTASARLGRILRKQRHDLSSVHRLNVKRIKLCSLDKFNNSNVILRIYLKFTVVVLAEKLVKLGDCALSCLLAKYTEYLIFHIFSLFFHFTTDSQNLR